MEPIENSKKENLIDSICCFFTYFGMNEIIFVFTFFVTPNVCSKFHVWSMYVMKLEYSHGSRLLFYDLSKKGSRGNFGSILDFPVIPN